MAGQSPFRLTTRRVNREVGRERDQYDIWAKVVQGIHDMDLKFRVRLTNLYKLRGNSVDLVLLRVRLTNLYKLRGNSVDLVLLIPQNCELRTNAFCGLKMYLAEQTKKSYLHRPREYSFCPFLSFNLRLPTPQPTARAAHRVCLYYCGPSSCLQVLDAFLLPASACASTASLAR
jgi:hypothetical protein